MVEKAYRIKHFCDFLRKGLLTGFFLAAVFVRVSQAENLPVIITDDETETLIHQITAPIFKAANINFNPQKIFIVSDPTLNAFVSDGNYLFLHTGTLIAADNVNQLSGVIAHESGHIAGGHIVRQKLQINQLHNLSVASLIAAGAAAAASGRGDAAMAVALGAQSTLLNALTSYQMHEERSADESAVKYLRNLKQSPEGLGNFIKKIQEYNRLNGYKEIPYFRTHPLSQERLRYFEESTKQYTGATSSPLDTRLQMVQAKLAAFLLPLDRVQKRYPSNDLSLHAQYANAIIDFRQNKLNDAVKHLDNLIRQMPDNPYFYELKGQFLFERGKADQALKALKEARRLAPHSPDILLAWAQAALESESHQALLPQIISALNQSLLRRSNLTAWLLLARAYSENGNQAEALYASAQYSLGLGHVDAARRQIDQAEKLHPSSALKLRLSDLRKALE